MIAADPREPDNFFGNPDFGHFDVDAEWRDDSISILDDEQ